jgi:hypothetical protein
MRLQSAGIRLVVGVVAIAMMTGAQSSDSRHPQYRIERRVAGAAPAAARFNTTQIALLEKLNRADAGHLDHLNELIVPDPWFLDERAYTTLPASYVPARIYPTLLVVYVPGQVFGAYESGRLERWGPVSTGGRTSPTPAGWFHLNWRATRHVSTVNPDWEMKWYFNFGNVDGLAFHQYPLPGHPASHGCVRLLERDAKWLFEWGEPWALERTGQVVVRDGTPVLIIGAYDFESPSPWRSLTGLATPIVLPPVLPPGLE